MSSENELFKSKSSMPVRVLLRTLTPSSRTRESCNSTYDAMPAIVQKYMDKVNEKIGTDYKLFNYYGAADAEKIIIAGVLYVIRSMRQSIIMAEARKSEL